MNEVSSDHIAKPHSLSKKAKQAFVAVVAVTATAISKGEIPPVIASPPPPEYPGLSSNYELNSSQGIESKALDQSESKEQITPPIRSLSEVFNEIDDDTRTSPDQKQHLRDIMQTIDAEKQAVIQTVWDNNILKGERGKSKEDIARDLDIYFPIYKAVEAKFNIPWQLVWMMHTEETGASIHKYPDHGTTRGAVQIGYGPKDVDPDLRDALEKAINDSDIYKFIPGIRYDKYSLDPEIKRVSNSNDGKELFASGAFFKYFTTSNHNHYIKPGQSIEEKYLLALMNYVGQPNIDNGVYDYRVRLYNAIISIIPAADKTRQNNTSLHEPLSL